jgi:hypothetical protein
MPGSILKRRWFHPSPGKCAGCLLGLELFLLLSEWLRLFPFNRHKGWTVLVAIACVGVLMAVMLLWCLAALIFRVRFQFTLRSIFVLTLAVAVPCSWLATELKWAREQQEELDDIVRAEGALLYDYQLTSSGAFVPNAQPPEPMWLREWLGADFFGEVIHVNLRTARIRDTELEHLDRLTHLQWLDLGGTPVTEAVLQHIEGLNQLEALNLVGTHVTDVCLEHVKGLTRLRRLCLRDNAQVTDAGLRHLLKLTRLEELDLTNTSVTDTGLEHLKELTRLQALYLTGTQVTDAGVENLRHAFPTAAIVKLRAE